MRDRADVLADTLGILTALNADADTELRKPDWFNTVKFPKATFQSSAIKAVGAGKFEVAEMPGADGKPEAVLSYEGAALNGDFNVVDQFLKTSGVPRPPSLRARGTTSSA